MEALRQLCGAHYSDSASSKRVPLNLIFQAVSIYLRQLVSNAPRAMVSSHSPTLKPIAGDMQAWMDKATEGMNLTETFRIIATDALFSMGVIKIGETPVGTVNVNGVDHFIGQPFAEPVDLDDLVFDIRAKRWDQCRFIGHRFVMDLEEARQNPMFDPEERSKLQAQTRYAYNELGDPRTQTLSQSTTQLYDEFDTVELWELWFPKERLVLTLPYQESVEGGFSGRKPLRIVNWQGPACGPFLRLSFLDLPSNVMPCSFVNNVIDLHTLINILWRKIAFQAERQKTILGVMGSATDDGERITRANDADAIRIEFPDRCKELSMGGVQPENINTVMQAMELFNRQAGNLDAIGGLSPQAATLGQDELLNRNASAQVSEMQNRTINFYRQVYKCLAFWWWKNPVLTYSAVRDVAGMSLLSKISPQDRQTPFEQLDWDIDPYSAQPQTPQSRLQTVFSTLDRVGPMMPMLAQQGVQLDGPALMQIISKYSATPDLPDIFKVGPPPQQMGQQQLMNDTLSHAQMAPANTNRTYTRRNVQAGMTPQANAQATQQLAMGSRLQPSQLAAMGRRAG